ncbi:MAG: hypothetical protein V1836_03290 [Candidatus Aenigmatarchaeota archaeon]
MKNLVGGLRSKQYIPVSKLVVIIFLVLLVVVVGNGVTGFTTSLIKLQETAANATQTQLVMDVMKKDIGECTNTLNTTSSLFSACRLELESKKIEVSRLDEEAQTQQTNITTYLNSISVLRENVNNLNGLVNSLAVNICCIRSVVNKGERFGYYYIKSNDTVCTDYADETLGTQPFSC